MFGQSNWKQELAQRFGELEQKIADLEKASQEAKAQNSRLQQTIKSVTRKLVLRLPLSLESLEKGLRYDLIFPEEVQAWQQMASEGIVLDVRSQEEFLAESIPESANIPLEHLSSRLDRISRHTPILLVCDTGVKSVTASEVLIQKGFNFVYVLKGGLAHYHGERVVTEVIEELSEEIVANV